ncbi:recombinase family protein [Micromonospora sp. LZ34]
MSRAKKYRRAEGVRLGGAAPYGLCIADGKLAHDAEAYPVARRIADELLTGSTFWAVTKRLNAEGVPSPRDRTWGVGSVSAMVRSPGFAGLQSIREKTPSGRWRHTAEVYRDEHGQTVSVGEGVITPDERARILRSLEERSTTVVRESGFVRRTGAMLGEVLRCTDCGAGTVQSGAVGKKVYRCGAYGNGKGCAGFTAPTAETDDAVSHRADRRHRRDHPCRRRRLPGRCRPLDAGRCDRPARRGRPRAAQR